MTFLRCLLAICYKDILSEFRRLETLNTLLFFSVLIIFLFSFALGTDPSLLKHIAPGLLWLVVLFSAVLALERSFQAEVEQGCLDRLVLYAVSHRAIFLGKLVVNFLFILIVQVSVLLMMIVLFDLETPPKPMLLVAALFFGDLGIATIGTFYALLLAKTRARQVMLPLLLFPMLVPLLLASVYATQVALGGNLFYSSSVWIQMLVLYDVIFLAACWMVAGPLMEV